MTLKQRWTRDALLVEFDTHLQMTCGASVKTRREYTQHVREFLIYR